MDSKTNELTTATDDEIQRIEFESKLCQLTERIMELSSGKIKAMIFFGSRLNPLTKSRVDSDLDYMVVTSEFVPQSDRLVEIINSETEKQLNLKGENHCVIPQGNIKLLSKRFPTFWTQNRINSGNSFVAGDASLTQDIKTTIALEKSSE